MEETAWAIEVLKLTSKFFDNKVNNIMNQISHNLYESSNLATIRDALLPKLMSGERRVLNNQKNKRSSIT